MFQYIVKIRGNDDGAVLTQIINPRDLNYSKTINKKWNGSFFIRYDHPSASKENLQEFNRIDIYEQPEDIEYKIFEGVIRGYQADFEGVEVLFSDFGYLFERRILFASDYTATAENVDVTLSNILTQLNALDDMGITLDTEDILTTAVDKEYKRGENFLKILKDLSVAVNGEWQVKDRKLQLKDSIGINRTIPETDEYMDFRYDIDNSPENSIRAALITVDSSDLSNAVLGKSSSDFSSDTDATSINARGRIESIESFNTTAVAGLSTQVTNYLELHKESATFNKITPNTSKLTFKDIDIGDTVPVFINTGSDLLSVDDVFKVVKINNKTTANSLEVNIEFAKTAVEEKNLIDDIVELKDKVAELEIS
jgi:hypothetical protein